MTERQREDYLRLIQALLECSPSQVLSVLSNHLELVDTELISVMVEVLSFLQTREAYQEAQYLVELIAYLSNELARGNKIPYARLAEEILRCDRGEERKILNAHSTLIDAKLVQIMRELAGFLKGQGDQNYLWLQDFANQVNEELKNDSPYLKLVHDILNCPTGEEQKLLASHSSLMNDALLEAVEEVADRLELQGEHEQAQSLQQFHDYLFTRIREEARSAELAAKGIPEISLNVLLTYSAERAFEWMVTTLSVRHTIATFHKDVDLCRKTRTEESSNLSLSAVEYKRQGDFCAAVEAYNRIFQNAPTDPDVYWGVYKAGSVSPS
ncbi:hypothetical protein LEP3755_54950 [Leptolyngbya sp. NIES-3755]|nr:hypothetical protein LEP3755_54950 [Leptolyngbya sp. NIES-3755]